MALLTVRATRDVGVRAAGRCGRRHHNDFRNADERAAADRGPVARHTSADARVIHLRAGEQGAVGHRGRRNAGTRADVAHLARLRGWDVVRRRGHDLEAGRTRKRTHRGTRRRMALGAIRGLARRIGMDIDKRRHDRVIRHLMAVTARGGGRYRHVVRRLHLAREIVEVRAVTADAVARRRMGRVFDLIRSAARARTRLETRVLRVVTVG